MKDPMKRPCSTERIAAGKSKVLHPEAKKDKDDSVQPLWCKELRGKVERGMAAMVSETVYDKQLVHYTAHGESGQCYGFASCVATQERIDCQEARIYNENQLTKVLNLLKNRSIYR